MLIQQNSKEMKKIIINLIETIPRTKITMFVLKTIRTRFKFIIDLVDPNNIRRKKTKSLLVPNYLKTTCDDANMIVNVNDHIGYQTYLNNTFDNSLLLLSKFLQIDKNDIIIDVGANIGTTSVPTAKNSKCTVLSIEPSMNTYKELIKNISLNRCRNIIPLNIALTKGDDSEELKFVELYQNIGNTGSNSIKKDWNNSVSKLINKEICPATTLDRTVKYFKMIRKVKLLKIDAEGMDLDILEGSISLIHNEIPVLFEWRIDLSQTKEKDVQRVKKIFGSKYKFYKLDKINNERLEFNSIDLSEKADNVFAVSINSDLNNRIVTNGNSL